MDTTQLLVLIGSLIGSGGLLTGIVAWRADVRKGPVDKQTAQVADAVAVSNTAVNWVQYQDKKILEQDARLTVQAARIDELFARLDRQERRLSGWGYWYEDLDGRWQHHREQDKPPAKPVG